MSEKEAATVTAPITRGSDRKILFFGAWPGHYGSRKAPERFQLPDLNFVPAQSYCSSSLRGGRGGRSSTAAEKHGAPSLGVCPFVLSLDSRLFS